MNPLPPDIKITIRPMEAEDLDEVVAIDRLSFTTPWPYSAYRYELNENQASFLRVAESQTPDGEKEVVGMVVVWIVLDEAHIANIAVHPDFRNYGIGKSLMVVAMREAILKGAHKATLEVRANNSTAHKLYREFGFEIVGRRSRYYHDNNEDALLMSVNSLGREYLEKIKHFAGNLVQEN